MEFLLCAVCPTETLGLCAIQFCKKSANVLLRVHCGKRILPKHRGRKKFLVPWPLQTEKFSFLSFRCTGNKTIYLVTLTKNMPETPCERTRGVEAVKPNHTRSKRPKTAGGIPTTASVWFAPVAMADTVAAEPHPAVVRFSAARAAAVPSPSWPFRLPPAGPGHPQPSGNVFGEALDGPSKNTAHEKNTGKHKGGGLGSRGGGGHGANTTLLLQN